MPGELERRMRERMPGIPLKRAEVRQYRKIAVNANLATFRDSAAAFIASSNMQNIAALAQEAKSLAGNDPDVWALVEPVVRDYADSSRQAQTYFGW